MEARMEADGTESMGREIETKKKNSETSTALK